MACGPLDWNACLQEIKEAVGSAITTAADQATSGVANFALEGLVDAVRKSIETMMKSLGTAWVDVGTPNLTGGGGGQAEGASDAESAQQITQVLGYVTWIGLVIAILSLVALGALIATRQRSGDGIAAVGKLGIILGAVILISGAGAIVAGLLPNGPTDSGGATQFLQSHLWWYMAAGAVVSVIIGGAKMAWEQRAEPGRETVKSLLTLIVVAGCGVTVVSLLVEAADSFSVWIIDEALNCDLGTPIGGGCFADKMIGVLAISSLSGGASLLVIILGSLAIFATIFQILLLVARGGMLVVLTGILPLSASFTNTEMGKNWFRKCVAWLVAFILYKPAAAIIYAAAIRLVATDFRSEDTIVATLAGLMLMVLALFAMPALMRFVTPMVGALAAGAGGGMAMAGMMSSLPTGASEASRLGDASGSGGQGSGGSAPMGSTGGSTPTASTSGAAGGGSGAGAGGGAAGGGAGAGAGGGAAAAGGGAAAAAGPAGAAVMAADEVKNKGKQAAAMAKSLGESAVGEGDGPDGSS